MPSCCSIWCKQFPFRHAWICFDLLFGVIPVWLLNSSIKGTLRTFLLNAECVVRRIHESSRYLSDGKIIFPVDISKPLINCLMLDTPAHNWRRPWRCFLFIDAAGIPVLLFSRGYAQQASFWIHSYNSGSRKSYSYKQCPRFFLNRRGLGKIFMDVVNSCGQAILREMLAMMLPHQLVWFSLLKRDNKFP